MRIQCATYNGHLGEALSAVPSSEQDQVDDLASWLSPTLLAAAERANEDDAVGRGGAPDVIAIGFQEMIPLHLALAGFTSTALDLHERRLKEAIESVYRPDPARSPSSWASSSSASSSKTSDHGRGSYSLIARQSLGGIALLVYSNDESLTHDVRDVEIATAGCGVLNRMGNKGAVGIRFKTEHDGAGWTFVTAHLAAHQNEVERRNRDWREIAERLVFVDPKGRESSLYDSGHLFVFGDLNYRISLTTPRKLAPPVLAHHVSTLTSSTSDEASIESSLSTLLAHDQLAQQVALEKTLHHLSEARIAFAPTYKFVPGTRDTYKKFDKRVPGWCDRILYATAEGEQVEVEMYRSVMDFTASDHKPVTALFHVPHLSSSPSLAHPSPFSLSTTWRTSQRVGVVLDRVVGLVWCLVVLAGFGKDARVGIVNLGMAALGAWVWKGGWRLAA